MPLRRRRRGGTTAIAMMRDEEDIVAETAAHMLGQVDEVIVLLNGSSDRTGAILEGLGVTVIDDPEVGFYQSAKLTRLARSLTTEWVVPFDADEVWVSASGERLGEVLEALPRAALVCEASVLVHVPTNLDPEGPPVASMQYRRPRAEMHRSVACRVADELTILPGAHGARYGNRLVLKAAGLIEMRHYPARSPEQLIRKIRNGAEAYAATDLPNAATHRWCQQAKLTDDELREVFATFHFSEGAKGLVHDPCPLSSAWAPPTHTRHPPAREESII
jgi:glycosyltransferase involved in cell wall biosynthesis